MLRSYRDWDPYRHFDYKGMGKEKLELYTRICQMDEIAFASEKSNLVLEVHNVIVGRNTTKKRKQSS